MSEGTAYTILIVMSVIVIASNFFIMTGFLKKLKLIRTNFERSMGIRGDADEEEAPPAKK